MATSPGDGRTTASTGSPVVAPALPRPRLGVAPLVAAAARGLVADGFRIVVFLVGAALLSTVVLSVAVTGLVAVLDGLDVLEVLLARTPAAAARLLSLAPIQALLHSAALVVVVAYVGMRMPARMISVSTISAPAIRRGVALVGAVVLAGFTWFVVPMRLTPILAAGVSLLPAVFAVAATRAPHRPPIAKGVRPYLLLAGAMLTGSLAAVVFVVSAPAIASDLSVFGQPARAADLDVDAEWTWRQFLVGQGEAIEGRTIMPELAASDVARIAALRTEVRAAEVRDGRLLLGELLAASEPVLPTDGWNAPAWSMPTPRSPRLVGILTIATLTDGRAVVLDPEPTVTVTPEWDGRLFRFWLGT